MPHYTFSIEDGSGARTESQDLENDEVAVHVARRMFDPDARSIRVGRREADAVSWLGVWESAERDIRWTAQS